MIQLLFLVALLSLANVASEQHSRLRRRLQVPDGSLTLVPFGVDVKINTCHSNKQPTSADYTATATAVMSWLDAHSEEHYNGSTTFRFVETTCEINSTNPDFNSSDCTADDDDTYQHEVSLDCHAAFESSNGDNSTIPTPVQWARTASTFNVNDFTPNYLNPAVAVDSPFRSPRRVSLTMTYAVPYGVPDFNTTASPTPAPLTSSTPPPVGSTINEPIILEWGLGTPNGQALREPTDEEYSQFFEDAVGFVEYVFDKTYNTLDTDGLLPEFVSLEGSSVRSQTYQPGESEPYVIVVETTAVFRLTEGTVRPPMWQWVLALRMEGLPTFRDDFIGVREGSIFQNPASLRWKALED